MITRAQIHSDIDKGVTIAFQNQNGDTEASFTIPANDALGFGEAFLRTVEMGGTEYVDFP